MRMIVCVRVASAGQVLPSTNATGLQVLLPLLLLATTRPTSLGWEVADTPAPAL